MDKLIVTIARGLVENKDAVSVTVAALPSTLPRSSPRSMAAGVHSAPRHRTGSREVVSVCMVSAMIS